MHRVSDRKVKKILRLCEACEKENLAEIDQLKGRQHETQKNIDKINDEINNALNSTSYNNRGNYFIAEDLMCRVQRYEHRMEHFCFMLSCENRARIIWKEFYKVVNICIEADKKHLLRIVDCRLFRKYKKRNLIRKEKTLIIEKIEAMVWELYSLLGMVDAGDFNERPHWGDYDYEKADVAAKPEEYTRVQMMPARHSVCTNDNKGGG